MQAVILGDDLSNLITYSEAVCSLCCGYGSNSKNHGDCGERRPRYPVYSRQNLTLNLSHVVASI